LTIKLDFRLGIDVGGTNTDAVVLDHDDHLVAKVKVPSTADVTSGVTAAVDAILADPAVDKRRITHVMLGTTHATNAVLERRNLRRVAVLRIGGPATRAVRPLYSWPEDLRAAISVDETIIDGGIEFDGQELVPFDHAAAARFLASVAGRVDAVAITSVFAPISPCHELQAEKLVRQEIGNVHVSLSHEIGTLGLLERENATVLNAALVGVAGDVAAALQAALASHALRPVSFFAQNDGTLMGADYALRYPVLTIGSGPANSIRGAAFLTGLGDALVADVGGTSTDVGVLSNGFPRESSAGVQIGGIRTNFRMPDLVTIALGGGTVISSGNGNGDVVVGPTSVGYRLWQEALVFGGDTATLTDSAVACGRAHIGQPERTRGPSWRRLLEQAMERADGMLAEAVDRVKPSRAGQPLIVVGGGSVLVPDAVPGVDKVIRPDHFDVANAIGAAIASVSGQVDRVFHLGPGGRQHALQEAEEEARVHAIRAGADPDKIEVVEVEEIPLTYLTTPAVRIRVKVAGSLGFL
jgi:N-methylhydantoinase A/oxoprolinase/acetone carboxylase beta subunit